MMKIGKFRFALKQAIKVFAQKILLPIVYRFYKRSAVDKNIIIFADAHHNEVPFSMKLLRETMINNGYKVLDFFCDFSSVSLFSLFFRLLSFMKIYATAGCVVICDYFLPVSSCKRPETFVVQLWHSCGLLKKFAYDTTEDIPNGWGKGMFKNYDLVIVSSPSCISKIASAMKIPSDRVQALGVSRTDYYYDKNFIKSCEERFYEVYPEAASKKIVLWSPTFRGNAANPEICGIDGIKLLKEKLPEDLFLLVKLHPYLNCLKNFQEWGCPFPTEELLPIVSLLITDYSSVLFDFLIFERPIVLFAPDLEEYSARRGFYIDYSDLPGPTVKKNEELCSAVLKSLEFPDLNKIRNFCRAYMRSCDGNATERIKNKIRFFL
jgi:CDP-ribitol ribitolphosphotransferase